MPHIPVMVAEVKEYLLWKSSGSYVDCTLGDGMHSKAILEVIAQSGGSITGLDRDHRALATARNNLRDYRDAVDLHISRFGGMESGALVPDEQNYAGFLFDLGLNSSRLEESDAGFSYMTDGPLDMRMSPEAELSAQEIISFMPEKELANLFFENSDERLSRRIARAIVKTRDDQPIETTFQLKDVILGSVRGRYGLKSVARCFQAVRIEVNSEFEELNKGLLTAFDRLEVGGRLVVISYHSNEDRIVKNFFRDRRLRKRSEPGRYLRVLTPKPIRPTELENHSNPAAKAARLRAAELAVVDAD